MVSAKSLCFLTLLLSVASSQQLSSDEDYSDSLPADRRSFKHGKPIRLLALAKKHKKLGGLFPYPPSGKPIYSEIPVFQEVTKPTYIKVQKYQGVQVKPLPDVPISTPETYIESQPIDAPTGDFAPGYTSDNSFPPPSGVLIFAVNDRPSFSSPSAPFISSSSARPIFSFGSSPAFQFGPISGSPGFSSLPISRPGSIQPLPPSGPLFSSISSSLPALPQPIFLPIKFQSPGLTPLPALAPSFPNVPVTVQGPAQGLPSIVGSTPAPVLPPISGPSPAPTLPSISGSSPGYVYPPISGPSSGIESSPAPSFPPIPVPSPAPSFPPIPVPSPAPVYSSISSPSPTPAYPGISGPTPAPAFPSIAGPSSGPVFPSPVPPSISGPSSGPIFPSISGPSPGPVLPSISGPSAGSIFPPISGPSSGPVFPSPVLPSISGPSAGSIFPPISGPSSGPVFPSPAPVLPSLPIPSPTPVVIKVPPPALPSIPTPSPAPGLPGISLVPVTPAPGFPPISATGQFPSLPAPSPSFPTFPAFPGPSDVEFPYPPSGQPIPSYIKDISLPGDLDIKNPLTDQNKYEEGVSVDEGSKHVENALIKPDGGFFQKIKGWKADKANAALNHFSYFRPRPVVSSVDLSASHGPTVQFPASLQPLPLAPAQVFFPPGKYESFPPNNIDSPPPLLNSYGVPVPHDTYGPPHVPHDRLSSAASEEEPAVVPAPTDGKEQKPSQEYKPLDHHPIYVPEEQKTAKEDNKTIEDGQQDADEYKTTKQPEEIAHNYPNHKE